MKDNIQDNSVLNLKLYAVKAFAILTVILAHSSYTSVAEDIVVKLLGALSSAGVVIFFTLSGYFFKDYGQGFRFFFKKKILWILVAWGFWGTLNFSVNFLKSDFNFTVLKFVNYMIGNGSYLYFLTVLVLIFLLYYRLYMYDLFNYIMIAVSIFSIVFTSLEIIPSEANAEKMIFTFYNPYLNIFNWTFFFSAGVLFQKYGFLQKWFNFKFLVHLVILLCVFIGWLMLVILSNELYNYYWFNLSPINEILLFIIFVESAFLIPKSICGFLIPVGKLTLPVYLMHISIVSHVFTGSLGGNVIVAFIRPVVVLVICVVVLLILIFITKKIKIGKTLCRLVGVSDKF